MWVGIDVGKGSHHACALDADDEVCSRERSPTGKPISRNRGPARELTAVEVRWAIDLTSPPLLCDRRAQQARREPWSTCPAGGAPDEPALPRRIEDRCQGRPCVIAETRADTHRLTQVRATTISCVELVMPPPTREDLTADWGGGVGGGAGSTACATCHQHLPRLGARPGLHHRSALVRSPVSDPRRDPCRGHADRSRTCAPQRPIGAPRWPPRPSRRPTSRPSRCHGEPHGRTHRRQGPGCSSCTAEITGRRRAQSPSGSAQHTTPLIHRIPRCPAWGPILGAEFLVAIGARWRIWPSSGPSGLLRPGSFTRATRFTAASRGIFGRETLQPTAATLFYMAALSSTQSRRASRAFYDRKRSERRLAQTRSRSPWPAASSDVALGAAAPPEPCTPVHPGWAPVRPCRLTTSFSSLLWAGWRRRGCGGCWRSGDMADDQVVERSIRVELKCDDSQRHRQESCLTYSRQAAYGSGGLVEQPATSAGRRPTWRTSPPALGVVLASAPVVSLVQRWGPDRRDPRDTRSSDQGRGRRDRATAPDACAACSRADSPPDRRGLRHDRRASTCSSRTGSTSPPGRPTTSSSSPR